MARRTSGVPRRMSSLVLFNGLRLNDSPPGRVRRYKALRTGAWKAARVLIYVYPSFPRLWATDAPQQRYSDANDPAFQYRWISWSARLTAMPKNSGAWKELAKVISGPTLDYRDVADVAKAIIELAVRDAEIERNSYRNSPRHIPAYVQFASLCVIASTDHPILIYRYWSNPAASAEQTREEQALMGRIRRAITNNSRIVEKCIYEALACRDATVVHRIAQTAPQGNPVFSALVTL